MDFPGQPGTSCLNVLCSLVQKTFELAELEGDDMRATNGICLSNAIFENIQGIGCQVIPGILDIYLKAMQDVDSSEHECMLLQGVMMTLWYDCQVTLQHLEQRNATAHIMSKALEFTNKLTNDFEVKKFMLGLTALLVPPNQAPLPEMIQ